MIELKHTVSYVHTIRVRNYRKKYWVSFWKAEPNRFNWRYLALKRFLKRNGALSKFSFWWSWFRHGFCSEIPVKKIGFPPIILCVSERQRKPVISHPVNKSTMYLIKIQHSYHCDLNLFLMFWSYCCSCFEFIPHRNNITN